jgi:hypothetical protein
MSEVKAPSSWKIEQALSAWMATRSRLLADDADLAGDEGALSELLGSEVGDVREVVSRLLSAIRHSTAMSDGATEMIADLRARQERYRRRVEQFRATIFAILDVTGDRKMEFPHGTISVYPGRASVIITDEDALEERFVKTVTTRTPDKAAIMTALKDGEVIEGAVIGNGSATLTVRTK